MNAAAALVRALEAEGVDIVFGYPGGAILPVYDALVDSKLRHILVRHEQAAAFAANGWARATGQVGVCIATSGPGATNLVTGIADAFADSVPMVIITGQVATGLMGTDAFQELDVLGMTMPVVKHGFVVRRAADMADVVHEAFRIARSGRPGPVLVDIPKDVAYAPVDDRVPPSVRLASVPDPVKSPDPEALARAVRAMERARKPLLYIGGGVRRARAIPELRALVETTRLPFVSTLMALGSVPTDHPLSLGMLGMHGTKAANYAVQEADLLVCACARFDDRATGKLADFAPHAEVIHIDIDAAEVGKLRRANVALVGDARVALRELARPLESIEPWRTQCLQWKRQYVLDPSPRDARVHAPTLLRRLSDRAPRDATFACDVGQHQMWVAQHVQFDSPDRHLTSGGLGAMGFGVPAAIGACFARPGSLVITVTGDGSIMMNLQELATIVRYALPLRIVLVDNRGLGLVRQWQELFHEERYSEIDLSDNPDFVRVAEAFGIPAFRVDRADQVEHAVERIVGGPGPLLCHVVVDPAANVWPIVKPGAANSSMLDDDHKTPRPAAGGAR
ncbi:MAG TPA: acetolactate synthase 2 catalytic subunit [Polyangiaceae bacterium]|nr:acetolactate synthase 2 catalytic subunit [Polyangiaceae bacterium]